MKYHGILLADMHIGAIPCEKLYQQFYEQCIDYMHSLERLDYIIILGDYFDHKFYLNESAGKYAQNMLQDMINVFKDKSKVKIRFVYGTESHECHQYNTLLTAKYADMDIKLIRYAEEEELFPEVYVLYLPEEHILDKEEYYKNFFEKDSHYNYIFGHGTIREGMKIAATQIETSSKKRKSVPVFSTAEFHKICKGETYFGHYHMHTDMDDVYYVGSFSRWEFGQEEPKGFYHVIYDDKKDTYDNEFIVNEQAESYQTIAFGYDNQIFQDHDSLEKVLGRFDDLVNTGAIDHLRFEFNIPEDIDDPEYLINYLNERYKFNKATKLKIVNGYVANKREIQKKEVSEAQEKYAFIFDKNLSLSEKIGRFIYIEYDKHIKTEDIDKYLYKPLSEILLLTDNENP